MSYLMTAPTCFSKAVISFCITYVDLSIRQCLLLIKQDEIDGIGFFTRPDLLPFVYIKQPHLSQKLLLGLVSVLSIAANSTEESTSKARSRRTSGNFGSSVKADRFPVPPAQ